VVRHSPQKNAVVSGGLSRISKSGHCLGAPIGDALKTCKLYLCGATKPKNRASTYLLPLKSQKMEITETEQEITGNFLFMLALSGLSYGIFDSRQFI
jgi:hypothetical protein